MRWKHYAIALAFSALAMPAWAQSPIATLGGSCTTGYGADQITAIENNIVVCNGSTWQNLLSAPAADPNYSIAIGSGVLTNDSSTGGQSGQSNIGIGYHALLANTTGYSNSAFGTNALNANSTGSSNTALGDHALATNTTAFDNSAIGSASLSSNTTGNFNTAIGQSALQFNTTGNGNVAIGQAAMVDASTGSNNSAVGTRVLQAASMSGSDNSGFGYAALYATTSGSYNVAAGNGALYANATGSYNIGIGSNVGSTTLSTGSNNILIGTSNAVDTPASNTSNFLDIGNTIFATGTNTGTLASPAGSVGIDTTTMAGTGLTVAGAIYASAFQPSSDLRLKKNIATLNNSLENLGKLRGVSFDWRTPAERDIAKDMYFDTEHHQMGVIAEEVEQVYPGIVHTAPNGLKSVNYDALMGPMIEAIKTLDGRTDKLTIAVTILYVAAAFQFLKGRRSRAA